MYDKILSVLTYTINERTPPSSRNQFVKLFKTKYRFSVVLFKHILIYKHFKFTKVLFKLIITPGNIIR